MEANSIVAIEKLYSIYHTPITHYLQRMVNDRETAEDLCHDTFIKALRFWDQLDLGASEKYWLYRIATYTAYDHLRQRRRAIMTIGLGAGTRPLTLMAGEVITGPPSELSGALLMGVAWIINLAVAE